MQPQKILNIFHLPRPYNLLAQRVPYIFLNLMSALQLCAMLLKIDHLRQKKGHTYPRIFSSILIPILATFLLL